MSHNSSLKVLAAWVVVAIGLAADVHGQEKSHTSKKQSMSAGEFAELERVGQRELLIASLKTRLRAFENVAYSTSTLLFKARSDCSAFPYLDEIPLPSPRSGASYKFSSSRLGRSYLTSASRHRLESPSRSDLTVTAFNSTLGEYSGTNMLNDGRSRIDGAIVTEKDIVDQEDRLSYWGHGISDTRGVYFIEEALKALRSDLAKGDSSQVGEAEISAGVVGSVPTIRVSLSSVLPEQKGRDGLLVVDFDPEKRLLPIAFRLERFNLNGVARKVRWFEAMRVVDTTETDGVWMPSRFQILQCGGEPMSASRLAVFDVTVDMMKFGSVNQSDVEMVFPAGARVVDRVREIAYIADGRGGMVGPVESISSVNIAMRRVRGTVPGSWIVMGSLVVVVVLASWRLLHLRGRSKLNGAG